MNQTTHAPTTPPQLTPSARLSLARAAWVVARRDFLAVLFSRAFLFFLLGPLFPVIVGALAGGISGQVQREARSEEHKSELQPLMRISYAVFCLKKTNSK